MNLAPPPATDLLLDLLSVPAGRALSAKALCSAGEHLGLPENAVRVALTRLVQQQKIAKVGRGAYALHPSRLPLILDVAGWQARIEQMTEWHEGWIAVADPALPAAQRTVQRRHERALALGGFRTWKPGLHLRPDNLTGGSRTLRDRLPALGLAPGAELLSLHPLDGAQFEVVVGLWDVNGLRQTYRDLLQEVRRSEKRRSGATIGQAAQESLVIGRAAIAQLARDPLLPSQIMKGEERGTLVEALNEYQRESAVLWRELLGLTI